MPAWKKALIWIGAGTALCAVALAFAILGDEDTKGGRLALVVTAFYVGFSAGAIAMVRGALYLMDHVGRQVAAMTIVVTVAGIVLAIVLHNVVYALTGVEEAFFFVLALFVGPVALIAAFIRLFRPYDPLRHG